MRLGARAAPDLRRLERPAIDGQRIVLESHVASPRCPDGVRWVRGVDLRRIVELAPTYDDVPELWTRYNAESAPVSLPDFLMGLSTAFAAGLLVHEDAGE